MVIASWFPKVVARVGGDNKISGAVNNGRLVLVVTRGSLHGNALIGGRGRVTRLLGSLGMIKRWRRGPNPEGQQYSNSGQE